MAAAQHKLSRREVLAVACVGAAARVDRGQPMWLSPALLTEQGSGETQGWEEAGGDSQVDCPLGWQKALARYARAEAELEVVAHVADDRLYDRALGRHNAALARLLRTAAPDLAAAAGKLDLILRHQVFELTFGEASLAALGRDLRQFAGLS